MSMEKDKKPHTRHSKYTQLAYTLFFQEKRAEMIHAQLERYDASVTIRTDNHTHVNDSVISLDLLSNQLNQLWKDLSKNEVDKYRTRAMVEMKRRRVMKPTLPHARDTQHCREVEPVTPMEDFISTTPLPHDSKFDVSNVAFTLSHLNSTITDDLLAQPECDFNQTTSEFNKESTWDSFNSDVLCDFEKSESVLSTYIPPHATNPSQVLLSKMHQDNLSNNQQDYKGTLDLSKSSADPLVVEHTSHTMVAVSNMIPDHKSQVSKVAESSVNSAVMGYSSAPLAASPGHSLVPPLPTMIYSSMPSDYYTHSAQPSLSGHPMSQYQHLCNMGCVNNHNHGYQRPYTTFIPYPFAHPLCPQPYTQPYSVPMAVPTTSTPLFGQNGLASHSHVSNNHYHNHNNNVQIADSQRLGSSSFTSPMYQEKRSRFD